MKINFFPSCIFYFLFNTCCLLAAGQQAHIIPFELTSYNNISIKAILNNSDTVRLMFHTAANAVTITEEGAKKIKSLRFTQKRDSIQSWGGGANSARISLNNSLRIGDLDWGKLTIRENTNSGQFTDGKFGIDLFNDWVINIDFDRSLIRLSKEFPKKIKRFQKLKLVNEDDELYIEAICKTTDSSYTNKFLIHSGYAGAILFDDAFAKNSKLNQALKIMGEKTLTDSYGNKLISKQAILPSLLIENIQLNNVPVGFFDGKLGNQQISIMGGDVIKRFNWVIDAKREFVYLQPNHLLNEDYRKM